MDRGESLIDYSADYWNGKHIDGGRDRTFGPCMARLAEVFYYARRPIKKFLDIGGGNGGVLDAAALYLPEHKELFYSVEKYPPKDAHTASDHYFNCDYRELDMKFDAGMCIEVIEHLTPRMLTDIFEGVACVSNEGALYLINSGQPEYVINENPGYLDPFRDGHIISYSVQGLKILLEPLGYIVRPIKGKSWASVIEYKGDEKDCGEVTDRVWKALPKNISVLKDEKCGGVMEILGMESIRAYSSAADVEELASRVDRLARDLEASRQEYGRLKEKYETITASKVWKVMKHFIGEKAE